MPNIIFIRHSSMGAPVSSMGPPFSLCEQHTVVPAPQQGSLLAQGSPNCTYLPSSAISSQLLRNIDDVIAQNHKL